MNVVVHTGNGEITEKKSRFLASLYPVRSEDEAVSLLEDVRKKYWDARHHVYAYVTDFGRIRHFSDDGEPTGTGGKPVMDCLMRADLTGALLVVTRYFGGTLLGTGGLTRAYGAAAEAALARARLAQLVRGKNYRLTLSYQQAGKLEWLARDAGGVLLDTKYGENVEASLLVPAEADGAFLARTADAFAGKVSPEDLGSRAYFADETGRIHFIGGGSA